MNIVLAVMLVNTQFQKEREEKRRVCTEKVNRRLRNKIERIEFLIDFWGGMPPFKGEILDKPHKKGVETMPNYIGGYKAVERQEIIELFNTGFTVEQLVKYISDAENIKPKYARQRVYNILLDAAVKETTSKLPF